MLKMEKTATTAEFSEIFAVSKKTISVWAKRGLMVKSAQGRYKLKESLRNFAQYCVIVREGGDIMRWMHEASEGRFMNDRGLPIEHDWEGYVPRGPLAGKTNEEIEAMYAAGQIELTPLPVLDQEFEIVRNPDGTIKRYRLIKPSKPARTG
jgi:hypothetical protein